MKRHLVSVILSLLLGSVFSTTRAQEILQLPAATWDLQPVRYHVESVSDQRKDTTAAGVVLTNGKKQPLVFEPSLISAVNHHLPVALTASKPNSAPLRLQIEACWIKDAVTGSKHHITVDLKLAMYRDVDGTSVRLYESSYRPVMQASGTRPSGYLEKTITDGLREFFHGFDRWAVEHPAQIYFMNHITVMFPSTGDISNTDTIPWRSDYRLRWDDFQGVATAISPFAAQSNCLYTLLTEPVFSNDTLYIRETIRPCFTRQASWVKSDSKQDTLLMHEQGHFDLCELYGRRFRKSVQAMTLSLTGFDREINTLFQQTWSTYQVEQDRYDRETEHGLITAVQLQWQALVADELEKLKEFASR